MKKQHLVIPAIIVFFIICAALAVIRWVAMQSAANTTPAIRDLGDYAFLVLLFLALVIIAILGELANSHYQKLKAAFDRAHNTEQSFSETVTRLESDLSKIQTKVDDLHTRSESLRELRSAFLGSVMVARNVLRTNQHQIEDRVERAVSGYRRLMQLPLAARKPIARYFFKVVEVDGSDVTTRDNGNTRTGKTGTREE